MALTHDDKVRARTLHEIASWLARRSDSYAKAAIADNDPTTLALANELQKVSDLVQAMRPK